MKKKHKEIIISFVPKEIESYMEKHSGPINPVLIQLEKETYKKTILPQMISGKMEGKFLQLIALISKAKKILDIGTFTGYSALMMAEALPKNGELITCEISKEYADIALRYFKKVRFGNKIKIKLVPAIETLRQIPDKTIDLIFIDADKISYPLYYNESMRILKNGGLIIADNVLRPFRIINPKDENNKAIQIFNKKAKKDKRVDGVMLPIRDGVYLIRKK